MAIDKMHTRSAELDDLATLNDIISTLNQAADVRGALDGALARIVELMGLESGLIFVRAQSDSPELQDGSYELVAHHRLPPALTANGAEAWSGRCRCQTLCEAGQLDHAVNIVSCSRLASVGDSSLGLAVHASVALRAGARGLGILNVIAADRESFDARSLALLTNIGSHLGVALERARLYDLVRERRVEEQAALLDLSNKLLGQLDLDDVMACVVDEARHLLHADASAVLLPEGPSGELLFRAASGWHVDPAANGVAVRGDPDTGPGLVMRTREHLVMANIAADPPEACAWAADMLASEGFRAHTLVPLAVDGRAVGVLMLDSRQPRSLGDDEIRLLQLIANQGAIAIDKARLHADEVERQQLERELMVARRIQLGLLPKHTPELVGWEFGVDYEAARQVGGDFYDIFAIPDGSGDYGIVVADVADKGIPAALIMAASRTMMRAIAVDGRTPATALRIANRLVLEDSYAGLFVTALFARLDPTTGYLTFANAGHMRPLRVSSGGQIEELVSAGIALGVLDDIALEEVQIALEPGDVIIFYTDGVTDAMNGKGDRFTVAGLRQAIASWVEAGGAGQVGASAVVKAAREAVDTFVSGSEQSDDLTLFALGRSLENGA